MDSFLWHDYETFGIDPRRDRVAQFGAIRTDSDLQPIGDPGVLYCQPALDTLPHPDACLITGITPQDCLKNGLPEAEFSREIALMMLVPGTCSVGYNSIRFDDEVSRNLFYRNFQDPYEREWAHGNSRWDLIDLVRACYALRPEGINWPEREPGIPSFRLEHLSRANGIEHGAAHDALADVEATLALARLIRQLKPRLFEWALTMRDKAEVEKLLDPGKPRMLIHTSARIPAVNGCTTLMLPLVQHPRLGKSVLAVDLNTDLDDLPGLSPEELHDRIFTSSDALPSDQPRIPVKAIASNRVPFLAPQSVLKGVDTDRINLDIARCERNYQLLVGNDDVRETIAEVFRESNFPESTDADLMIYSGFFSHRDKVQMSVVRQAEPGELARQSFDFQDERLEEMLFRYRARNWPESLNAAEFARWQSLRRERLLRPNDACTLDLSAYQQRVEELRSAPTEEARQNVVLDQLSAWPDHLDLESLKQ